MRRKKSRSPKKSSPKIKKDEAEFSLQKLLESREKERVEEANSKVFTPNDSDYDDDIEVVVLPKEFKQIISRDESIFALDHNDYPFDILKMLDQEQHYDIHCFPELDNKTFILLKYHTDIVTKDPTIYFSIAQAMLTMGSTEIGEVLIKYGALLPDEFLDYGMWLSFMRETIATSNSLSIYLLGSIRPSIFVSEDAEKMLIELFIFYFASLITPQIEPASVFKLIINNFTNLLENAKYSDESIEHIINTSAELLQGMPVSAISNFISLFPLFGFGVTFTYHITIIFALKMLGIEGNDISTLCESIHNVKKLCESENDSDLISASAVLALSERALGSSAKLGLLSNQNCEAFSHGLIFTINTKKYDAEQLVRLREQIHVTRTQAEMLAKLCKK